MTKKLRWFLPALLALMGILAFVAPTLAALPEPDSLVIKDVAAYQNARVEGDQLYLVTYFIGYTVLPDDDADKLFVFRLMDGSTEIASAKPYPFYAQGYGLGVVAFYLDADDAPDWMSSLTVEITGAPMVGWSGTPPSTTTDTIDWNTGTIQEMKEAVSTKILILAGRLQQAWDVELLTTVQGLTILNSTGATYFSATVPYLSQVAPYAIGQYTFTPTYPDDKPGDITYANWLEEQISGTIFDVSPVARSWGVSRAALTTTVYYGFVVVFFVLLIHKAGLRKGMMLLLWPFVIGGAFFGVPLVVTILGGFMCLIGTVWLFYKAVA